MRRRAVLALGTILLVGPTAAGEAQIAGKTPRVGFIEAGSREANQGFLDAFRDGLSTLGWRDGATIEIIDRWAEASDDRLQKIVAEFVAAPADVLVAAAVPATLAAMRAT